MRQCKALSSFTRNQCVKEACDNSDFCIAHGGNRAGDVAAKKGLKNLRLTTWLARLTIDHVQNVDIKSLRDEIGILRVILEEKLNACETSFDLTVHSAGIISTIQQIQNTVTQCHKLEESMGKLIDEETLMQFAGEIVQIITEEESDPEVIGRISKRIIATHTRLVGENHEDNED